MKYLSNMMRAALVGVSLLFICLSTSFAAVPHWINFQGMLTYPDGTPMDTTVSIIFRLYPDFASGTPVWDERHTVTTVNGNYNAVLGAADNFPQTFYDDGSMWLGIQVGTDAEMSPRIALASVPYAYRIGTIDEAQGGTISGDINVAGKANIGNANTNVGDMSLVVGENNAADGDNSTVAGGRENASSGTLSFVGGGDQNYAVGTQSTIAGGSDNRTDGNYSVIAGGNENRATGAVSAICGGVDNHAEAAYSAIGGGSSNWADSIYATVAGGHNNFAEGQAATIAGGEKQHDQSAVCRDRRRKVQFRPAENIPSSQEAEVRRSPTLTAPAVKNPLSAEGRAILRAEDTRK
ncbi:MAG: hypothetical protein IPK53_03145 [bacterium]|nr:hypothetical protein [bacterium]